MKDLVKRHLDNNDVKSFKIFSVERLAFLQRRHKSGFQRGAANNFLCDYVLLKKAVKSGLC